MNDFDFIAAFMGFDILKAEAISEIVGRCIGKARIAMVEAGLTAEAADRLVGIVVHEGVKAALETTETRATK